jgi:hypothetical protein
MPSLIQCLCPVSKALHRVTRISLNHLWVHVDKRLLDEVDILSFPRKLLRGFIEGHTVEQILGFLTEKDPAQYLN